MKLERAAFEPAARSGAAHVLNADPIRFAPDRMSGYAHWYEDVDQGNLVAVITPGEKTTVVDEVLAYGLAWQHHRDLILLVPDNMVVEAMSRNGWLATKVRVFSFDGETHPRSVPNVGRVAILEPLADLPARQSKVGVLTDSHRAWADAIITAGLTKHERGGYVSWHHEGLQVLKLTEKRAGLRVQAGVQYKNPPPGREVFDKAFATEPSRGELAVINAKVALAVEDGGSLTVRMREHKMQATLIGQPEVLGLTHLWREFPAWRGLTTSAYYPAGRLGSIDFLGVDYAGVLHVVETKIGHDPKVVLQALDYALWVRANDEGIRALLKAQGHLIPTPPFDPPSEPRTAPPPAPIHLVLGADESGPAFNRYLAGQIEALDRDCEVHIYLTADPGVAPLRLTQLSALDMWEMSPLVAKPVAGPRWLGN